MAFRKRVGKLRSRKPKRNHESQIEQKFEWSRDPVQLVWIAPFHPPGVMVKGIGTGRQRVHDNTLKTNASADLISAPKKLRMILPSTAKRFDQPDAGADI